MIPYKQSCCKRGWVNAKGGLLQDCQLLSTIDSLGATGNAQFTKDIIDMLLDGAEGNHQLVGNGLIRQTIAD
jgi:hypothetical protein